MTRPRGRRGYATLAVVFLLALVALLMESSMRLLMDRLGETRRRADRAYASELALSGLDWGRACLESGRSSCDAVHRLVGGEIAVRVERRDELVTIRSEGRIVRGGTVVHRRGDSLALEPRPPAEPRESSRGR